MSFDDLLDNNRRFAASYEQEGVMGIANAGVGIITCMDARLDPLRIVGLEVGDAKIIRTPGGFINNEAFHGCILAVHLLRVSRILVIAHTQCAMAQGNESDVHSKVLETTGADVSHLEFGTNPDQLGRLRSDVTRLRAEPLIQGRCEIGGFIYDVDTGLMQQVL